MKIKQVIESAEICRVCGQTPCNCTHISEEKVRLDPKCWKGKKIGNPKTKVKGGVRVNNCVPAESVAEGTGNVGNAIKSLYQKIYRAGDDEVEYFYNDSPIFAQYWDEYEGDLDSIIAEVDPSELQIMLDELESYVQQANLDEGSFNNYSPMAKDSIKADKIRSLKNLIAIAREQGRQLRVQELELELKKLQDVAEGLGKDIKRLATGKDAKSRAGQEIAKAQQASMTGDNKTAHKHFKRYDKLDTLANKGVAENLDSYEFHTSVPMGDFLPSRHGKEKYLYLHDLTKKSGDGKGPMLVTVERPGTAVEIANEFGGRAVKTKLGTYRIVKDRTEVDEGMGKDMAKLIGIPAVAGAMAIGAQHYDDQQPHVQIGDKSVRYIANPGWGRVPDDAMTVTGKDGKQYRLWKTSGKGGGHVWLAAPAEEVKEGVAEGEKVGHIDADKFDDAMARLKKLAGAGPMKTVYDPQKRVYKNVPTAVQPGDKK